jgi:hypothetical protein
VTPVGAPFDAPPTEELLPREAAAAGSGGGVPHGLTIVGASGRATSARGDPTGASACSSDRVGTTSVGASGRAASAARAVTIVAASGGNRRTAIVCS